MASNAGPDAYSEKKMYDDAQHNAETGSVRVEPAPAPYSSEDGEKDGSLEADINYHTLTWW